MNRKNLTGLMLALALLCMLTLQVCAAELPDLSRTGSIRLTLRYQSAPVAGGDLTLYQVATVREADGYGFLPAAGLEAFDFSAQALADTDLAERVLEQAKAVGLAGQTKQIGNDGTVVFDGLGLGLYLLEQKTNAPGYSRIRPFLVSIPMEENGTLLYDVDASPKPEPLQPEPSEPTEPQETPDPSDKTTETEPDTPTLPQTGQLNWPIPVLLALGSVCLIGGLLLLLSGRRERE